MKYYTKKWYLNGCIDKPVINDDNYFESGISIHDTKIINTKKNDDCYTIIFDYKDIWCDYHKMSFYDYEIIENINLNGACCLADEMYIKNNIIEYHLLIWSENIKDYNNLGYFIIKAKKCFFYENSESRKEQNNSLFSKGVFIEADTDQLC